MKISHGEMTGYEALMQELFTATGDLELLMKMDSLFKKASEVTYEAPASQRPAGPISLPGMAWLTVAFIPWIIHWSTFDIPKVSHWISVGLPLFLSALIVTYRFIFSRPNSQSPITNYQSPTFMEWGGLGFFIISAGLALFETPYGKAGISVCWDVHRLWIIRELARSGAQIILLPMDNDFNGTRTFPPFHAADMVFRAVENRLAFGEAAVSGLSMVVDPYGRITAEGKINERGVTVGETFVVEGQTLYTRFGDWFGWTMVASLIGLVAVSLLKKK
ncbi:MAG: hypothetical protein IPG80_15040 [Anaerolineales bacterium]|nr:hypothetical protein [Anaerolineales bacterium]